MRLFLLPLLAALASCSALGPDEPDSAAASIFTGELTTLNGQTAFGSQLRIELFSKTGSFEAPDRYRISGGCVDNGFLDKADGRFWSGSAPAKNTGIEVANPARRGEAHCPPEDAARYVHLMEIMYEGPVLKFDQGSATFNAPTKGSAEFRLGPVYAN